MIQLKVREVAQGQGITTIKDFAQRAGLAYDTAADLWHARMKRVDLNVLDRVCKALQCRIEDVLEQIEDRQALLRALAQQITRSRAVHEVVPSVN